LLPAGFGFFFFFFLAAITVAPTCSTTVTGAAESTIAASRPTITSSPWGA
jgi:hypothetical protein